VLIALYENGTPFRNVVVDLGDREASAAFFALWPLGKIPLLRDEGRGQTVPETSIMIEYLERHYPGTHPLMSADDEARLDVRLWDRVFDLYVQESMQAIGGGRRAKRTRSASGRRWRRCATFTTCWRTGCVGANGWPARPFPWRIAPPRPRCSTPASSLPHKPLKSKSRA